VEQSDEEGDDTEGSGDSEIPAGPDSAGGLAQARVSAQTAADLQLSAADILRNRASALATYDEDSDRAITLYATWALNVSGETRAAHVGDGVIDVDWDVVADPDGDRLTYELYMADEVCPDWETGEECEGHVLLHGPEVYTSTFSVAVEFETQHYYQIIVRDPYGNSVFYEPVDITPHAPIPACSPDYETCQPGANGLPKAGMSDGDTATGTNGDTYRYSAADGLWHRIAEGIPAASGVAALLIVLLCLILVVGGVALRRKRNIDGGDGL
jgi:hypothetical protein